jgi:glycosyltransferase involved in cell wall biosynthesis
VSTLRHVPQAHLLLAGQQAPELDLSGAIRSLGLDKRVTIAGYLKDDEALTDHIAACDVSLNLRWPTAEETSGPWLRALAAGKPTIITDLPHLVDVPSLDPRTWTTMHAGRPGAADAVCVSIDILDEDHSLRLALRRLGRDAALRSTLGGRARGWWEAHHTVDAMIAAYEAAIARARTLAAPGVAELLRTRDAGALLDRTLEAFGLSAARVFEAAPPGAI